MTGSKSFFVANYTLIFPLEPYVFPNDFIVSANTGYESGVQGRRKAAPVLARLPS
jgi:hypothetical protein